MEVYRLSSDAVLTPVMIQKYIDLHRTEEVRQNKLQAYYLGKHDILQRTQADATKPNNKLVNSFPQLISDTHTGYFMGTGCTYSFKDEGMQEVITEVFQYNDEAAENASLAKQASIMGISYEQCYVDADAKIRFKKLDARYCIPIYADDIEEDLLYFIRYYDSIDILTGNKKTHVEVYSSSSIQRYLLDGSSITFQGEEPHYFRMVPVVIYRNNDDCQGDFEQVISLVDAYNKMQSDSINDYEAFVDSYLVLGKLSGTQPEDIAKMKQNRVILLDDGASAQWLTKTVNDGYIENIKNRLENDIYLFSKTPNLTDKNFASNASGVAIKYKLISLENVTSTKERHFKLGLQRRLEIICNALSVLGTDYNYLDAEINFHRSLPENLQEIADYISKVGHLLSEETQIQMLGIDVDAKAEIEKRQQEKEASVSLPFDISEGDA